MVDRERGWPRLKAKSKKIREIRISNKNDEDTWYLNFVFIFFPKNIYDF